MATGVNNLPYPGKVYSPFDILTAEELNEDVANIESLATGTGIGDGSISTAAIANAAVTASKIDFTTQSYTPTTSGITLGTGGTITAQYLNLNGLVWWRFRIVLGTGGTLNSAGSTVSLPVPASGTYATGFGLSGIGDGHTRDVSAPTTLPVRMFVGSTTTAIISALLSGAYVNAGAGITYASGDIIEASGLYIS